MSSRDVLLPFYKVKNALRKGVWVWADRPDIVASTLAKFSLKAGEYNSVVEY